MNIYFWYVYSWFSKIEPFCSNESMIRYVQQIRSLRTNSPSVGPRNTGCPKPEARPSIYLLCLTESSYFFDLRSLICPVISLHITGVSLDKRCILYSSFSARNLICSTWFMHLTDMIELVGMVLIDCSRVPWYKWTPLAFTPTLKFPEPEVTGLSISTGPKKIEFPKRSCPTVEMNNRLASSAIVLHSRRFSSMSSTSVWMSPRLSLSP